MCGHRKWVERPGGNRSRLGADSCVGENEDARFRGMEADGPTSGSDRRRHGPGGRSP